MHVFTARAARAIGLLCFAFALVAGPVIGQVKEQKAPNYPGVRVDSGVMVFDDLRSFENTITQLKEANQSPALEYSDQALDDFETAMGFFSLRRHLLALEEGDLGIELKPAQDPDRHHVADDYLATLLSPQHEILIGRSGYIIGVDFTFELAGVSARELAAARRGDLAGFDVNLHRNDPPLQVDPKGGITRDHVDPCDGWRSCSAFTTYDDGERRIKGRVWIQNYPFYATAGTRTKHYKKKNNGGWKKHRADEIWASAGLVATNNTCHELDSGGFGDTKFNRKKVQETRSWWNQVTKAHDMVSLHGAEDNGETCQRVLDLFNCDSDTYACGSVPPPPSTGLHIRTKFSNGNGTWTPAADNPGDGIGVHTYATLVGDVDADGRDDLIFVGQGWSGAGLNIRVKRSNGDGTWTSWSQVLGDGSGVHAYPTLVGDVDGDNRTDLIFVGQNWSGGGLNIRVKRSNGDGTWTSWSQVLGDGSGVHAHKTLVGDVDGDSRSDLIFVGQGWSGAGLNIRVKRSNGSGTWTSWSQVLGDGSSVHVHQTLVGDINGDTYADLVFIGQNWSGAGLNIRTKKSNGNGTWTSWSQVTGDGSGVHAFAPHIGTVDANPLRDLIFVGQNWSGSGLNVRTKRSNGGGTWTHWSDVLGDGSGVHTYPSLVGDFNGDNLTDLAFVGQGWSGAGLNIRTKFSQGNGQWTPASQVLGDGSGVHTYPTLVGDFDGDGTDDIVFVGQDW